MKRVLSLLLVLVLVISTVPAVVLAESDWCDIEIRLSDKTYGQFGEDVFVTFMAQGASEKQYSFTFSAEAGYPTQRASLPKGYTYEITIDFTSKGGGVFYIINYDGKDIQPLVADKDSAILDWYIIQDAGPDMPTTDDGMDAEAPGVYAKFKEALDAVIADAEADHFESLEFLDFYEGFQPVIGSHYSQYVGGDAAVIEALSPADAFQAYVLWIIPMMKLSYGDYERHFGTYEAFIGPITKTQIDVMRRYVPDLEAAYKELMEWQYSYFVKRCKFYNFVPELFGEVAATEPTVPQTQPVIRPTEPEETIPAPTEPEESGWRLIWGNVVEEIKGNIITIIITLGVGVALGYLMFTKKKKNYDY